MSSLITKRGAASLAVWVLLIFAISGFVGALIEPFVSNTFEVQLSRQQYLALWGEVSHATRSTGGSPLGQWLEGQAYHLLDREVAHSLDAAAVQRLNQRLQQYAITTGGIHTGVYYLPQIIASLYRAREYFVAVAVTLFSLFLPVLKILLCLLALIPVVPLSRRQSLVRWVRAVSKWSMGDVFIVALIVVFFKATGFHYRFRAEAGLYLYALSFFCSSFAAIILAKRWQGSQF